MSDYYAVASETGVSRFNMIELLNEGQPVRVDAPEHALHGRAVWICGVKAWIERLPLGNEVRLCAEYRVRVRVSRWWQWRARYEVATFKRGHLDVCDMLTGEWRD